MSLSAVAFVALVSLAWGASFDRNAPQSSGGYEPQTHDRYELPSSGGYEPQTHDRYEPPTSGVYERPSFNRHEPPTSGGYEPPIHDRYEPPTSGGYEPPIHDRYEPQTSGGYERHSFDRNEPPISGGYEPPINERYEPPTSGGYEPPIHDRYEPPTSGGYERPSFDRNKLPTSGGYESPTHDSYEPPASGGYEPPTPHGYQPPRTDGYQTPIRNGYQVPTYYGEQPRPKIEYDGPGLSGGSPYQLAPTYSSHDTPYNPYSPPSRTYQPSHQPPPPAPARDVLNEGDKLNARLESLLERLRFQEERFVSLNQRLSLQRKFLDTFTKVYLAEIKANDEVQDSSIKLIQDEATQTASDLKELEDAIEKVEYANKKGTEAQLHLSISIAEATAVNVRQSTQITELIVKISNLKDKLLQVLNNVFQVFSNKVGAAETVLNGATATEKRRMCETGRINFVGPAFAEYSFQSDFNGVPSVALGLCGARFDLDSRPPVSPAYSYGPKVTEPHALGIQLLHYVTENTLTVSYVDRSFGDAKGLSADVCFMACSITPNIYYPKPHDH